MMKKHAHLIAIFLLFLLFVWLSRALFGIVEVDGCLDGGGSVDYAAGVCVDSRHGKWGFVSAQSYLGWLIALGIPALVTWGFYLAILRLSRNSEHESA